MKIEIDARLILTVPSPKGNDNAESIVLATEMAINEMAYFIVPKTGTTVGVQIHVSGEAPKDTCKRRSIPKH